MLKPSACWKLDSDGLTVVDTNGTVIARTQDTTIALSIVLLPMFGAYFLSRTKQTMRTDGYRKNSVVVRIGRRTPVLQEVSCLELRIDAPEDQRRLFEIEAVGKVVGVHIGVAQRRQPERLFNQLEKAPEVMRGMRDVLRLRVR